jgi:metal-sulfur cluster biosynthetic enzyme
MAVPNKEEIMQAIKPVEDPEIHISVVDLGLIYDVNVSEEGEAVIDMTLTTPACPYGPTLVGLVKDTVEKMEGISRAEIRLVWEPQWDPKEMASDEAKDELGIW